MKWRKLHICPIMMFDVNIIWNLWYLPSKDFWHWFGHDPLYKEWTPSSPHFLWAASSLKPASCLQILHHIKRLRLLSTQVHPGFVLFNLSNHTQTHRTTHKTAYYYSCDIHYLAVMRLVVSRHQSWWVRKAYKELSHMPLKDIHLLLINCLLK